MEGDEHEHVDAAQEVEAEESVLGIFRRAGDGVAEGEEKLFHGAIIPRHGSFRQALQPGGSRSRATAWNAATDWERRHLGGA